MLMNVVAVIPCLNEETFISDIVTRAGKYVQTVIVVDDGSTDLTKEVAEKAGAKVIRHESSRGAGAATRSGLEAAKAQNADVVITIDGDGQHNPDEIPRLIAPVENGNADIVIGSRFLSDNGNVKKYRKFGIDLITTLFNIGAKAGVTDSQSGFRAYSRKAVNSIIITDDGFGFSVETLIKARKLGLSMTAAPISCIYHAEGSTLNPLIHGMTVVWSLIKYRILLLS
jgi:glycosyltransferase involved in cell wall biosynthesis